MCNSYMIFVLILFATRLKLAVNLDASIWDEIEEAYQREKTHTRSEISDRHNTDCSRKNIFKCLNGHQCIEQSNYCDGKQDCTDASDESTRCREIRCPEFSFRCAYGACVDGKAKCNNVTDCADNSDEWSTVCSDRTLPPTTVRTVDCSSNQFKCDSGECINYYARCDGVVHCKDGSDETRELCSVTACPLESYRCKYGACVHKFAACNNIRDCADNSDENDDKCVTTTRPPPTRQWYINMCRVPDPPLNGKMIIRTRNEMRISDIFVQEGSSIVYSCNRYYDLSPNIVHYSCAKGKWYPMTLPSCVRQRKSWWPYIGF